jgi:sorbitol-specific phosphotransferase system component IIC
MHTAAAKLPRINATQAFVYYAIENGVRARHQQSASVV